MTSAWFEAVTADSTTGALARSVDWAATPLGTPDTWSTGLRTATEMCFGTRFPVMLTWGHDLVMIYNDCYRDMLGSQKHPGAMGRPAAEVWHEIWPDVGPLFERVLASGVPTWATDRRLVINRSGFDEETYFTFSYSALRDESGAVRGVLDIVSETTEQVVDRRRLGLLGELSTRLHGVAGDVGDVGQVTVDVLGNAGADIRAADVHLRDGDGLLLLATTRARAGVEAVPAEVLSAVASSLLPAEHGGGVVAPLLIPGDPAAAGVVVLEPSLARPLDDGYRSFLDLVVAVVGTGLGAAVRHLREVGELRRVSETLQLSMLPGVTGTTEVAARYVPAGGSLAVGGDWYDVVRLEDDRLALLVGDCVGHGLHAATVMGQLRSASRALLLEHHGAAATLEGLDRFARSVEGAECTTVFCGIVDARAGSLTYASAGHPPPLVVGRCGVSWLEQATGVPLAVPYEANRVEATVALGPTDTLVLYTDGLVERRDAPIDVGLRALADTVSATAPGLRIESLADLLIERLLPTSSLDDVALLVHRAAA